MRSPKTQPASHRVHANRTQVNPSRSTQRTQPIAAFRQRAPRPQAPRVFNAPEAWYEPTGRTKMKVVVEPAGQGYVHPVTVAEVRERLALLPPQLVSGLEVLQFSRMTRKRRTFPCYGMQWGTTVYLYPIEESLVEPYVRPPKPAQLIEAEMFGGKWAREGDIWTLTWTPESIRDFYLNNVLIHEVGHINDQRNSNYQDRERYANWFAIEYGYRASRGLIRT